MTPSGYRDFALYARLLREARAYWPHIVGIFLCGLLSTPLKLLTPLPLKIAVDSVIGARPLPGFLNAAFPAAETHSPVVLIFAASLVVVIALLSHLQGLATSVLSTYTSEKLVLQFRSRLFGNVQRLSLAYHDLRGVADSTYRIQHDAPAIQHLAIEGVIPFITGGITIASMLYVSARLDWQLALIAVGASPIFFLITQAHKGRIRAQWRTVKQLESASMTVVQEVLGAVRVVKAFGQEDREEGRFVGRSAEHMRARLRLALVEGRFGVLVGTATAVGAGIVLFIGVRHVQAGVLTLGDLLLLMGYLWQLSEPLKTMSWKAAMLQSYLTSAERAFALLDEVPDVPERPHAQPLGGAYGAITFQDVAFAYQDRHLVLRSVSFEVTPGSRVGIAGPTGSGKTTLMSLLTRFYDPTAGRILLDGGDLRDYRLADLRNQFSIVPQEPVLFSTSIAENIAYARPGADLQEIIAAAKAANAHEFVMGLPDGYDMPVGERGMRLSGGERQRISLARAFLRNAPILILDEPTSSVDVETEAVIMEAMERLMRGRTTFMITHRTSLLEGCNLLVVIEDGRVVEVQSGGRTTVSKVFTSKRLTDNDRER